MSGTLEIQGWPHILFEYMTSLASVSFSSLSASDFLPEPLSKDWINRLGYIKLKVRGWEKGWYVKRLSWKHAHLSSALALTVVGARSLS